MTSPTSGITGNTPTATAQAASAAANKSKALGDKDTFMKLLVAQLKYQDPSKPADSTQFLAQTAQFTQVEQLDDIADMMKSQRMIGASSLVGKTVTYMDGDGGTAAGRHLGGEAQRRQRTDAPDREHGCGAVQGHGSQSESAATPRPPISIRPPRLPAPPVQRRRGTPA